MLGPLMVSVGLTNTTAVSLWVSWGLIDMVWLGSHACWLVLLTATCCSLELLVMIELHISTKLVHMKTLVVFPEAGAGQTPKRVLFNSLLTTCLLLDYWSKQVLGKFKSM